MNKEVIKQVLEALDIAQALLESAKSRHQPKVLEAYNALQEAWAKQPTQQEPVAWYRDEDGIRIYYESKVWDDATPLYTSPPQQESDDLIAAFEREFVRWKTKGE